MSDCVIISLPREKRMELQCWVNTGLGKINEFFFSSVHQFCYFQLLSQWILQHHSQHIPENSVTFGMAGDRRGNAGMGTWWRIWGPSWREVQPYLNGQWDYTSHVDQVSLTFWLQPQFLPYFSDAVLPLTEIQESSIPGLSLAFFPGAPALEAMLGFMILCSH